MQTIQKKQRKQYKTIKFQENYRKIQEIRKRKNASRCQKMLKNKGFWLIIGKVGKNPAYIYYIRVGMPDAGCAYGDWGMHHVYIYIKKNPINPIKSGMRL